MPSSSKSEKSHIPFKLQLLQVIIGVLVIGLGSGFYLIANLGPGSRDGLMTGIQKKTNLSFCRF